MTSARVCRTLLLGPLLTAVVAASGCGRKQPDAAAPGASTPPATSARTAPSGATTAAPSSQPEWPVGILHASYWECAGGLEFVMKNLWRENAVTLELHEGSRRLEHVPSASGAKYADQSIEFWTKSKKMTTKWNQEHGTNWMS